MIITVHGLERRGEDESTSGKTVLISGLEVNAPSLASVTFVMQMLARVRRAAEERNGYTAVIGLLLGDCEIFVHPRATPPRLEIRHAGMLLAKKSFKEGCGDMSGEDNGLSSLSLIVTVKRDGHAEARLACGRKSLVRMSTAQFSLPNFLEDPHHLGSIGVVLQPAASFDCEHNHDARRERMPSLAIQRLSVFAATVDAESNQSLNDTLPSEARLLELESSMQRIEPARMDEPTDSPATQMTMEGTLVWTERQNDPTCYKAWTPVVPAAMVPDQANSPPLASLLLDRRRSLPPSFSRLDKKKSLRLSSAPFLRP